MKAQPTMSPLQALDLLSANIGRLSGTREDHAVLLRAEGIVREALLKLGNGPAEGPGKEDKEVDGTPMPVPSND